MNSRQAIVILATVFLITLIFLTPVLRGDGVGYYAYLRSFAIDGDFNFKNEYLMADKLLLLQIFDDNKQIKSTWLTKKGLPSNFYSVGCSLLWIPFFIIGHLFSILNNVPRDGYSYPYIFSVGLGTALYAFIGLIFIYKLCRSYFSASTSLMAILSLWFASNLPIYMYFLTFMSHGLSLFMVSCFIYFWQRTLFRKGIKEWIILGSLGGLMTIVYYVNGVFLLLPFFEYLNIMIDDIKKGSLKILLYDTGGGFLFLLSFAVMLLPGFFIKNIIYGSYFVTGYEWVVRGWEWLTPRFIKILFSSHHGLFSWNPIYLIGLLGYAFFYKRDRRIFYYFGICFMLFLYIISVSQIDTAVHSSFGSRTFISCMPIFAIGLGSFIEYIRERKKLLWFSLFVILLIIWNFGFMFQWGINMVSRRFPISWRNMIYNQVFVAPKRLPSYIVKFFAVRTNFVSQIQQEDLDIYLKERDIKHRN